MAISECGGQVLSPVGTAQSIEYIHYIYLPFETIRPTRGIYIWA